MSSATFPTQAGSLTDSEGGEGRHLVQWLRGSLSSERGARKAAQQSVVNLEKRVASLEKQLQAQKSGKSSPEPGSRLHRSSSAESREERDPRIEISNGTKALEGQAQMPRLNVDERLSLEAAAWKAWQTFSGEMAKLAEQREARQAALGRRVDSLSQQVETLLPKASQSRASQGESSETSDVAWRASKVPHDYHDVPGPSRNVPVLSEGVVQPRSLLETAARNGSKLGARSKEGAAAETKDHALTNATDAEGKAYQETKSISLKSEEKVPSAETHVGSLAIWGELPSGSASAGRPPGPPVESTGSFSLGGSRLKHMRRSTDEDDLGSWSNHVAQDKSVQAATRNGGGVSLRPMSSEDSGNFPGRPWSHHEPGNENAQPQNGGGEASLQPMSAESSGNSPLPGVTRLYQQSSMAGQPALSEDSGTLSLPGTLYSPLEDDSIWDSIFSGTPGNVTDEALQNFEGLDASHALANMRGQLDSRFLGAVAFEGYGGEDVVEERHVQPRPSQMPYVTLPNTPLHEAAGLQTQHSRSDSEASSDFR